MIRALLFLVATLLPAAAETARVLTGEHGDFTRLVIELPPSEGWTLGRTAQGYAFAAKGEVQPSYDLGKIWQRIDRRRLLDLAVDKSSGALALTLGCDCHVFPFEYQPGIVVLDVKPGPAPEASAFELPFQPPGQADAIPQDGHAGKAYDWLAQARTHRAVPTLPLPLPTGSISLQPLRDELLEQIARGAADGIVDMELPGTPQKVDPSDSDTLWANVRIGEQPGVIVTQPGALVPKDRENPDCAAAELLDVAAWGEDRPPLDLLAEARGGLYGEFDVPDEAAVLRAVQALLYLGFGAEAGQTADLLGPNAAPDRLPLYRSMAVLVDESSDPSTPFAPMLDCPGPAALWSALAHDRLPPGPGVNRDAILQAFQALPDHLRQHLGPSLAEKFLARNDVEAVRIIRNAIERTPEADPGTVALLDAKTELHEGNPDAAQAHAETVVSLDGKKPDGLVALVESHFRKLEPMDASLSEALIAQQRENEGTEAGAAIDRAVVLALALSGQIDAAFTQPRTSETTGADLWQIVQHRAPDDDFLRHAVLSPDSARPVVTHDVAQGIGQRLLQLGFPDAALVWLGPVDAGDAPEQRLVAARAELGRGNAQAASDLLAGLQGAEAAALRADALVALGDVASASNTLAAVGDVERAARLDLWTGEWNALTPAAPTAWQKAAEFVGASSTDPAAGLLARSGKAVDASLASRDAIEALLSSVPSPAAN